MQTFILRPSQTQSHKILPLGFQIHQTNRQPKRCAQFLQDVRKTRQCHLQILWLPNLQLTKWKLHLLSVKHHSPPVSFWQNSQKNCLFSEKHGEGGEETLCLIRQPARAFAQATRRVDRLSSAVSEEAELQDQSPSRRGQASGCR